jgi:predicted nucleotidyltransferase
LFDKSVELILLTLEEAKRQLHDSMPVLQEKYGVAKVEVFGSYARCGQTPQSDIDLLITYSETPDVVGVNNIKRFLKRKLA